MARITIETGNPRDFRVRSFEVNTSAHIPDIIEDTIRDRFWMCDQCEEYFDGHRPEELHDTVMCNECREADGGTQ